MTHEVKNNHDAPLGVAGVTIGAGKSVGIEADVLRGCLGSNAIKQWIKLELIEIEGLEKLTDNDDADAKAKAEADAKAKAEADAKAKAEADAKAKAEADAKAKANVKIPGQNSRSKIIW